MKTRQVINYKVGHCPECGKSSGVWAESYDECRQTAEFSCQKCGAEWSIKYNTPALEVRQVFMRKRGIITNTVRAKVAQ